MTFRKNLFVLFSTSLMLLTTACVSTNTQESTGQYIDNSVLTAKVKTAIFKDPSLKLMEINVVSFKGDVQLKTICGLISGPCYLALKPHTQHFIVPILFDIKGDSFTTSS